MEKKMLEPNQIQDNKKLSPEVVTANIEVAERAIRELKKALHEGCEVVISIENYTSQQLGILKQSTSHNNGHFQEAPGPYIPAQSIVLCSSEGGTGVGNKNYILYDIKGADLLIYWHSARIGGKTYWADFRHGIYQNKNDKEILNIGKKNQTKGVLTMYHGNFVIKSTFGEEVIRVAVTTKGQTE